MNRCRTCKFFHAAANNDDTGSCHRYPPTVQPVPLTIELPDDSNDRQADTGELHIEVELRTNYPFVDADDWCGEQRQLAFPRDEAQR
jgi:hypothetical protein